jgi:hypothetical protein
MEFLDFELWKIVGNVEEPSTFERIKTVVFMVAWYLPL